MQDDKQVLPFSNMKNNETHISFWIQWMCVNCRDKTQNIMHNDLLTKGSYKNKWYTLLIHIVMPFLEM